MQSIYSSEMPRERESLCSLIAKKVKLGPPLCHLSFSCQMDAAGAGRILTTQQSIFCWGGGAFFLCSSAGRQSGVILAQVLPGSSSSRKLDHIRTCSSALAHHVDSARFYFFLKYVVLPLCCINWVAQGSGFCFSSPT